MATVLVLGAGMNGLTTAMLLARDGHEVTVLERDPAAPPPAPQAWDHWERPGRRPVPSAALHAVALASGTGGSAAGRARRPRGGGRPADQPDHGAARTAPRPGPAGRRPVRDDHRPPPGAGGGAGGGRGPHLGSGRAARHRRHRPRRRRPGDPRRAPRGGSGHRRRRPDPGRPGGRLPGPPVAGGGLARWDRRAPAGRGAGRDGLRLLRAALPVRRRRAAGRAGAAAPALRPVHPGDTAGGQRDLVGRADHALRRPPPTGAARSGGLGRGPRTVSARGALGVGGPRCPAHHRCRRHGRPRGPAPPAGRRRRARRHRAGAGG